MKYIGKSAQPGTAPVEDTEAVHTASYSSAASPSRQPTNGAGSNREGLLSAVAGTTCPACTTPGARVFYEVKGIPVNSVLQLETREEAIAFPLGNMALAHCRGCGFIFNTAFDPERLEYSDRYEGTQSCSGVFRKWHQELANELVERHRLRGRRIIEIGCGSGEFLRMLCEAGNNRGLGFDPAYHAGRDGGGNTQVEFIRDFYGPKYADRHVDFVCCKMTLEHISATQDFVERVRSTVGDRHDAVVLFQVPNVEKCLRDFAFWDVYYEHCSYFSLGSLGRLFRRSGFDVRRLWREYDDQYIMIECVASEARPTPPLAEEDDLETLAQLVDGFEHQMAAQLRTWGDRLRQWKEDGKKVVVWSSSSKTTAFLTTLPHAEVVEWVVDINPRRHGHFMPKGGQEIVGPDFLIEYQPDVVVVMNPIYENEIVADLADRGLTPEIVTP